MKNVRLFGMILWLGGLGMLGVLGCNSAPKYFDESDPRPRRALLIGIDDYQSERVLDLRGAVNDVHRMRRILIEQFAFDPASIRLLENRSATREAILKSLAALVAESGDEDLVYLHFSGHGSQIPDFDADELDDELDETLVPADGRTGDVPDITDDELGAILGQFTTPYLVVVLDSCHSGTATRDPDIRDRFLAPDDRTQLYQGRPASRSTVETEQRYVLLTGAAAHQTARDGRFDGQYHGYFTHSLASALESGAGARSIRDVMETDVARELERIKEKRELLVVQDPQLEAPEALLRKPLFQR